MNENSKRIAKNTLFLYFRMMFTMVVSLYTSRVVLNTLGVDDFGVYQTVGGIVALLSFVNNALTVGSSRFLTYELGTGNVQKLKDTFSTVLSVHILLSLIIAIVAETAGLWYVYNKLVVAPERFHAAIFAYHISVLTSFITITQVPYNSSIVSHERMSVYAYASIVEVSLKLGIVYLLTISEWDKLKMYAILLCLVQFGIAMFYRLYCIRNFKECHYSLILRKDIFKNILSYSGWNLIASTAVALCHQGYLVLINAFFSPATVAARAVANQVNMAANHFVGNFRTAVNPQIVKQFAANNIEESRLLLLESTKYSYYMMLILCIPIYLVARPLLNLWLGIVPEYATEFLQWSVLTSAVAVFDQSFYTALSAKGNIRNNSLISSSVLFIGFGVTYICFRIGFSPVICAVILFISQSVLSFVVKPILLVKIVEYPVRPILLVFTDCAKVSLVAWPVPVLFHYWINESQVNMFFNLTLQIIVSVLCVVFAIWGVGLSPKMKSKIKTIILTRVGRK